jgi:hypothetical protein
MFSFFEDVTVTTVAVINSFIEELLMDDFNSD